MIEAVRGADALMAGRLDAAEHHAQRALELGLQVRHRASDTFALQMFLVRRQQRRLDEIEGQVRRASAQFAGLPIWRCVLALLDLDLDRLADARGAFDALVAPGGRGLRVRSLLAGPRTRCSPSCVPPWEIVNAPPSCPTPCCLSADSMRASSQEPAISVPSTISSDCWLRLWRGERRPRSVSKRPSPCWRSWGPTCSPRR